MTYRPRFTSNEFHRPTGHYSIKINGHTVLYAYIRKNACTAFKRLINRRLHPKYVMNKTLGREKYDRYHISGNMRYFAQSCREQDSLSKYEHIFFVYRDPVDRFSSVFTNKFVDNDSARDIKKNFECQTGQVFENATFKDFMNYASKDFEHLDCHMWPQKAHLVKIDYSAAIPLESLESSMKKLIGAAPAQRWFGRKINASRDEGIRFENKLVDVPVYKLREYQRRGKKITKNNFITEELKDFLKKRYRKDYEMISDLNSEQRF